MGTRRSSAGRGPLAVVAATLTVVGLATARGDSPAGTMEMTGQEVVDRFIEAIGGREALAAIESFQVEGSYRTPARGAGFEIPAAVRSLAGECATASAASSPEGS